MIDTQAGSFKTEPVTGGCSRAIGRPAAISHAKGSSTQKFQSVELGQRTWGVKSGSAASARSAKGRFPAPGDCSPASSFSAASGAASVPSSQTCRREGVGVAGTLRGRSQQQQRQQQQPVWFHQNKPRERMGNREQQHQRPQQQLQRTRGLTVRPERLRMPLSTCLGAGTTAARASLALRLGMALARVS